jgi:hypothetical protein
MRREGMADVPPQIPMEVVRPRDSEAGNSLARSGARDGVGGDGTNFETSSRSTTPFHPVAAGLMILIDSLWGIPEFAVVSWPVTVTGCFLMVFVLTYFIQRRAHRDGSRTALWKALFLASVAAVPLPVMGTSIGLALLAWFGIKHPRR